MKKTAFLCLMLAAVLYFAGSFWQPLLLGQNGTFGYASARDMTGNGSDAGTLRERSTAGRV